MERDFVFTARKGLGKYKIDRSAEQAILTSCKNKQKLTEEDRMRRGLGT